MMNTIQQTLSEIKARADKATAGPWTEHIIPGTHLKDVRNSDGNLVACEVEQEDSAHIIAARTDAPALVRALEKAIEQRNYHMDNMRLGTECKEKEDAELAAILTSGQKGVLG